MVRYPQSDEILVQSRIMKDHELGGEHVRENALRVGSPRRSV